jgi:arsenic resistance protein ArsH
MTIGILEKRLLTRDASAYLADRYSERKEDAAKLEQRVQWKSI